MVALSHVQILPGRLFPKLNYKSNQGQKPGCMTLTRYCIHHESCEMEVWQRMEYVLVNKTNFSVFPQKEGTGVPHPPAFHGIISFDVVIFTFLALLPPYLPALVETPTVFMPFTTPH